MSGSIWQRIFHQLVDSRRQGRLVTAARTLLAGVEIPYRAAVGARNWRFDAGHGIVRVPGVRIISVGNVTMGGTGKTPLVKWLAQELTRRGSRVAIVSRGYGARAGEINDEARELLAALPGIPHEQDSDRVLAVRRVCERTGCDVVLLDDGFQHRRLARDVDIVLLDALNPFGNGRLFPRGILREPLEGLRRAHLVCLTRAECLPVEKREEIRQRVLRVAPRVRWCEMNHVPVTLVDVLGNQRAVESVRGVKLFGFCGIGNPLAFRRTLERLGGVLVGWREYPDHFAYAGEDERELIAAACGSDAQLLVCTQKDLVKIGPAQFHAAGVQLMAVVIEMKITVGARVLQDVLEG